MSTPHLNPPPSRAHVSGGCPVCRGAGVLPSMTVAGLTNPCPRCLHALHGSRAPLPAGTPSINEGLAQDASCEVSGAVDRKPLPFRLAGDPPVGASEQRRHDDEAPTPDFVLLLIGIALGGAGALLLVGIFRVFG